MSTPGSSNSQVPPTTPALPPTVDHVPSPADAERMESIATGSLPQPRVPSADQVPGFEILEELGRGGMGVVYKARQVALNRIVALKMILAGGHASQTDLERFRTEAAAIAALQHPHIVQVYEVGEHGGLPYFSLEYCPGGSLAAHQSDAPLPPRRAAELVANLADAMQAAHEKGIIHRDLKPANVLLAKDGSPRITDFGLAKHLEGGAELTRTGAVLGTPSYLAPEQAAGKVKELWPACDISALGAILYHCLTGRPPFQAATSSETLLLVMTAEPVPPSRLNAKIPRDLEAICLKCLHKNPASRYANAADLAVDLRRFLAGKPTVARPLGRLGHGGRWARRHPVAAGLLALVLIGVGLGAYFALQRPEEAPPAEPYRFNALTDPEIEYLWAIATLPSKAARLRAVRDALNEHPDAPQQPRTKRLDCFLHAAVGLDSALRGEVEFLLLAKLQQTGLSEQKRRDVALAAAELGDLSPLTAGAAAYQMLAVLSQTTQLSRGSMPYAALEFSQKLAAVTARMEPGAARQIRSQVTPILIRALNKNNSDALVEGLLAQTAFLEPKDAATLLNQAMSQLNRSWATMKLAQQLSVIATKLDPKDANTICAQATTMLTQNMKVNYDQLNGNYYLANIGADELVAGLLAVAPYLDSKVANKVAAALTEELKKIPNPNPYPFTHMLAIVATHIDAEKADSIAVTLTTIMRAAANNGHWMAVESLARALSAVVSRLEAPQATAVCTQVATLFSNKIRPDERPASWHCVRGLSLLAPHLDPKQLAAIYVDFIRQPTFSDRGVMSVQSKIILELLSQSLAAVTERLDPKVAENLLNTARSDLLNAWQGINVHGVDIHWMPWELVKGLVTASERQSAAKAAAAIVREMNPSMNDHHLAYLAQRLAAVTTRLQPHEASDHCARAAAICIESVRAPGSHTKFCVSLIQGLSALAAHLDSAKADEIAAALVHDLKQPTGSAHRRFLNQGLSAVTTRMERTKAASIWEQVARADEQAAMGFIKAMHETTDRSTLPGLATALVELTSKMERNKAADVCAQAATVACKAMASEEFLLRTFPLLVEQIEPEEIKKIATILLKSTDQLFQEDYLALALSIVAARFSQQEAAALADQAHNLIANKMTQQYPIKSTMRRYKNIMHLSALVAETEPKKASSYRIYAADRIIGLSTRHPVVSGNVYSPYLSELCNQQSPATFSHYAQATSAAVTLGFSPQPLVILSALNTVAPMPSQFTTQELVDLLKHPLCVGDPRRIVLDHLGIRYRRRFADQWDFVRFVREHNLPLDLTTPPQRPALPVTR